MKTFLAIISVLVLSFNALRQKQTNEENPLERAYKQKSTQLLSGFIDDWRANTTQQSIYTNDTIKCIHEIIRDMMMDTSKNSRYIFGDLIDTAKFRIFQSTVKYGVVNELNPDSIILQDILRSGIPDKSKLLALYNKNNTKGRADILLMDFYQIPGMKDSLLDSISEFRPDTATKYLCRDKKYISQLASFIGKGLGPGEKRLDFLNRKIAMKYAKPIASHSYIDHILIDNTKEWAYISYCGYDNFGYSKGAHILLHKENQKWHFFGAISYWVS